MIWQLTLYVSVMSSRQNAVTRRVVEGSPEKTPKQNMRYLPYGRYE